MATYPFRKPFFLEDLEEPQQSVTVEQPVTNRAPVCSQSSLTSTCLVGIQYTPSLNYHPLSLERNSIISIDNTKIITGRNSSGSDNQKSSNHLFDIILPYKNPDIFKIPLENHKDDQKYIIRKELKNEKKSLSVNDDDKPDNPKEIMSKSFEDLTSKISQRTKRSRSKSSQGLDGGNEFISNAKSNLAFADDDQLAFLLHRNKDFYSKEREKFIAFQNEEPVNRDRFGARLQTVRVFARLLKTKIESPQKVKIQNRDHHHKLVPVIEIPKSTLQQNNKHIEDSNNSIASQTGICLENSFKQFESSIGLNNISNLMEGKGNNLNDFNEFVSIQYKNENNFIGIQSTVNDDIDGTSIELKNDPNILIENNNQTILASVPVKIENQHSFLSKSFCIPPKIDCQKTEIFFKNNNLLNSESKDQTQVPRARDFSISVQPGGPSIYLTPIPKPQFVLNNNLLNEIVPVKTFPSTLPEINIIKVAKTPPSSDKQNYPAKECFFPITPPSPCVVYLDDDESLTVETEKIETMSRISPFLEKIEIPQSDILENEILITLSSNEEEEEEDKIKYKELFNTSLANDGNHEEINIIQENPISILNLNLTTSSPSEILSEIANKLSKKERNRERRKRKRERKRLENLSSNEFLGSTSGCDFKKTTQVHELDQLLKSSKKTPHSQEMSLGENEKKTSPSIFFTSEAKSSSKSPSIQSSSVAEWLKNNSFAYSSSPLSDLPSSFDNLAQSEVSDNKDRTKLVKKQELEFLEIPVIVSKKMWNQANYLSEEQRQCYFRRLYSVKPPIKIRKLVVVSDSDEDEVKFDLSQKINNKLFPNNKIEFDQHGNRDKCFNNNNQSISALSTQSNIDSKSFSKQIRSPDFKDHEEERNVRNSKLIPLRKYNLAPVTSYKENDWAPKAIGRWYIKPGENSDITDEVEGFWGISRGYGSLFTSKNAISIDNIQSVFEVIAGTDWNLTNEWDTFKSQLNQEFDMLDKRICAQQSNYIYSDYFSWCKILAGRRECSEDNELVMRDAAKKSVATWYGSAALGVVTVVGEIATVTVSGDIRAFICSKKDKLNLFFRIDPRDIDESDAIRNGFIVKKQELDPYNRLPPLEKPRADDLILQRRHGVTATRTLESIENLIEESELDEKSGKRKNLPRKLVRIHNLPKPLLNELVKNECFSPDGCIGDFLYKYPPTTIGPRVRTNAAKIDLRYIHYAVLYSPLNPRIVDKAVVNDMAKLLTSDRSLFPLVETCEYFANRFGLASILIVRIEGEIRRRLI